MEFSLITLLERVMQGGALEFSAKSGLLGGRENVAVQTRPTYCYMGSLNTDRPPGSPGSGTTITSATSVSCILSYGLLMVSYMIIQLSYILNSVMTGFLLILQIILLI